MFYNLNKHVPKVDEEEENKMKKQRRNIRQKATRTFDKRPEKFIKITDETHYTVGERIYIEGVNRNGRGGVVVEPSDFLNILDSGFMITDNIVTAYMHMLVHSNKFVLNIQNTYFWNFLCNMTWDDLISHLKFQNWNTFSSIFNPGLEALMTVDIGLI